MAIGNGLDKTKRVGKDFYQTHRSMVRALCSAFNFNMKLVLDVGSGNNIINEEILKTVTKLKEISFLPTMITCDKYFPADIEDDFLEADIKRVDVIVSNPPYNKKNEFIRKSILIADTVIILLPLQVLNYISFCDEFLDIPEYLGRITMYPKLWLSESEEYKQGGVTGYGWFMWSHNNNSTNKYEVFRDLRNFLD